jgi:hypothetical protein
MDRIGGTARVREELAAALAEGRGVTAKIRWVTKFDEDGRNRWVHCTPLIGTNGHIGVWMVVLVDPEDGKEKPTAKRWKPAPPVDPSLGGDRSASSRATPAVRSPAETPKVRTSQMRTPAARTRDGSPTRASHGSASPHSVTI